MMILQLNQFQKLLKLNTNITQKLSKFGPAFVAAADVAGYRGDARVRAWQAAHARLQPLVQVGVLSSLSGAECEGGSSEYVSVAAYAEWLEEAVRELGGAKLARIKNKVPL